MSTQRFPVTNTVVVTGASSGIGEACALHLDQLGFRVFAGVRREIDGEALQCKASNKLTSILLDVTDTVSITSTMEKVTKAVGENGLAGLINNAGIAVAGPLEFLPITEMRKQFEVNVLGQIAVTQAFLPLIRQGRGRVINIGSLGGRIAMPFIGPYCAAKFSMEALTDALRLELRPWHIPVSIIEPGFIATPIWEKSREVADVTFKNLPKEANHLYGMVIPSVRETYAQMGKTGTPVEEVVKVIVHALTSTRPKARYIVGRGSWLGTVLLERLPAQLRDLILVRWLIKRSSKSIQQ